MKRVLREDSNRADKMPKILLVHNYYQIPGGEDTVVANEKRLLEDNGHKVLLYSRNNSELKTMNFFGKLCLPFATIFSIKTYKEVKKIIKEENIDIVHVHNTLTLITPSVFYAAFASKIPVVQTLHNFRMQCPNGLFFREGHICEECLEKGLIDSVRHKCYRNSRIQTFVSAVAIKVHRLLGTYRKVNFICLTEFNKSKLLELNEKQGKGIIDEGRVFVKPNFTDIRVVPVPYQNRKNQCVFAGRLEEIKGIRMLMEAWQKISEMDLVLCGIGPLEDWCKKYIASNHMENVEIKGYVRHEELIEIMRESKALILPSLVYEGFPMTIVESLACGTPVIGSDVGNIGNLILDGENGLKFVRGSVEDLRDKVRRICDMSESSRRIYDEKYDIGENYMILQEIYKRIGIDK